MFHPIDLSEWPRREYYKHYMGAVRCSYSLVANLDITSLAGNKLYPAMLWLLTKSVNAFAQFRTVLTSEGLGIFDEMHPSYTIFNRKNESFSSIWTLFQPAIPRIFAGLSRRCPAVQRFCLSFSQARPAGQHL